MRTTSHRKALSLLLVAGLGLAAASCGSGDEDKPAAQGSLRAKAQGRPVGLPIPDLYGDTASGKEVTALRKQQHRLPPSDLGEGLEAAESEAVGDYEDRAEGHGGAGQHRVQQARGG